MSSGLGITERAVLNLVQEFGHLTVSGVRGAYPHIAPNSIRRAMRSLAAKGFAGLSETTVLLLASPLPDGFSSLSSGEKPERGDVPTEANMSKRTRTRCHVRLPPRFHVRFHGMCQPRCHVRLQTCFHVRSHGRFQLRPRPLQSRGASRDFRPQQVTGQGSNKSNTFTEWIDR